MRQSRLIAAVILAATAGLASACTPVSPSSANLAGTETARRCYAGDDFRVLQNSQPGALVIRTRNGTPLRLEGSPDCVTDQGQPSYGVRPFGRLDGQICSGDSVYIDIRSAPIGNRTCQATVSTPLTDAEVAALPDRRLP